MDDIIEKLNLLDYHQKFCKNRGMKPISRTYFAFDNELSGEDNSSKFKYMIELCYWLISLGFEDKFR
jgi:NIMA (never in mitosis gene a)-related kinase